MTFPFTKAHGAMNDFLLTWEEQVTAFDLSQAAQAICDRHTGVGADGWLLVSTADGQDGIDGAIRLFNSDGSEVEISGNGTRCAAAFLIEQGFANKVVRLRTGAGVKHLRLLERHGTRFLFEMNMGSPSLPDDQHRTTLEALGRTHDVTLLNVGNPQCAVFADEHPTDWRTLGAALESHSHFPHRTNVSFVKIIDRHTIDVRFFERGVGETMSSGTGSTGAAAAAALRQLVQSPVEIRTPAGPLHVRWENDDILLTGPAEITARGDFYSA